MSEVRMVAVIGAGTMGGGIALVAASHGYDVLLIDVSDDQLGRANAYHAKTTARNVEKGRMSQDEADAALARIQTTTEMARLEGMAGSSAVSHAKRTMFLLRRNILATFGGAS